VSLARYLAAGFQFTRGYVQMALADPDLVHGFRWITRVRTQQFWFTPRLMKAGVIPRFVPKGTSATKQCLSCGTDVEDNLVHFLCRCTAFTRERKQYLKNTITQLKQKWFGLPLNNPARAALAEVANKASATVDAEAYLALSLLGTGVGGGFWFTKVEAAASAEETTGSPTTRNGAGAGDSTCGLYAVLRATAGFLQAVMPIRKYHLKGFSKDGHTSAYGRRLRDRYGSSKGIT